MKGLGDFAIFRGKCGRLVSEPVERLFFMFEGSHSGEGFSKLDDLRGELCPANAFICCLCELCDALCVACRQIQKALGTAVGSPQHCMSCSSAHDASPNP